MHLLENERFLVETHNNIIHNQWTQSVLHLLFILSVFVVILYSSKLCVSNIALLNGNVTSFALMRR